MSILDDMDARLARIETSSDYIVDMAHDAAFGRFLSDAIGDLAACVADLAIEVKRLQARITDLEQAR